ncbi:bifunctional demethylmenaquinone methyltransferase/2-methoxy-6-polyprenyl-1,4-benzoquinol methylase UbiE [Fluviispira multicolorata]|uniref:Demethylmenaquinone methyltransferase n=1 Tax=Fluviispira multicolorata TaxID=2654512 RepID=A0A833JG78_9BACT|nr:bifunctional demethylmenaquinone methyltransferase/2-methoxy-6-polyprenyl-1,4-benzoquinol methylase UbiE [Fluviispira multicolorata]KAB8032052.1 bifunctional demethylmenaquinone methyltransferase/2-methoxy-6-polyprenyl-1,4-benzoquinol methylase UbiE [Fluviispira multicolorata]
MSIDTKQNQEMILSEKSLEVQKMFDKISGKYDFLNRLLSAGQDIRWRNYMIKKLPKIQNKTGTLYDVACGTGDVLFSTATKRNDYQNLTGFDISNGMLEQAKERGKSKFSHIYFQQASAENIPAQDASADAVTISFGFRNVDKREKALQEFHRILKNGGTLFILEFFPAKNNIMAKLFDFYFKKILPKIGGIFSDKSAYEYLPKSVSSMPSGNEFIKTLSEIGFIEIEQKCWLAGATRLFKAVKKS